MNEDQILFMLDYFQEIISEAKPYKVDIRASQKLSIIDHNGDASKETVDSYTFQDEGVESFREYVLGKIQKERVLVLNGYLHKRFIENKPKKL